MGFTSEETGLIGDLLIVAELEDLRLEARPPGSKLENSVLSEPSSCHLWHLGLSSQEGPSLGKREAAHVHQEETCLLPRPAEGLRGEQDHSRALRKAARQPSLRGSAPACSHGHRQQEKADWNSNPTAAAKEASSPAPRAFPICFLEEEEGAGRT